MWTQDREEGLVSSRPLSLAGSAIPLNSLIHRFLSFLICRVGIMTRFAQRIHQTPCATYAHVSVSAHCYNAAKELQCQTLIKCLLLLLFLLLEGQAITEGAPTAKGLPLKMGAVAVAARSRIQTPPHSVDTCAPTGTRACVPSPVPGPRRQWSREGRRDRWPEVAGLQGPSGRAAHAGWELRRGSL